MLNGVMSDFLLTLIFFSCYRTNHYLKMCFSIWFTVNAHTIKFGCTRETDILNEVHHNRLLWCWTICDSVSITHWTTSWLQITCVWFADTTCLQHAPACYYFVRIPSILMKCRIFCPSNIMTLFECCFWCFDAYME